MMARLALATALGLLGLLAAGFAGTLHPAFDSIAVLRPHLGLAALLLAAGTALLGLRAAARTALAVALLAGATLMPSATGLLSPAHARRAEPPLLRVISFNLNHANPERAAAAGWLAASGADVLLLQEVSERNLRALEPLRPLYPVRLRCGVGSSGVMVLSRLPAAAPGRCPMGGLALQPLQYRGGSVTLASVHLAWPWPFPAGQDVQFRTLRPLLATVQGPLVVGGDFNMVPWSAAVRALEREARLVRPSGLLFSHWIPALGLPLPIDHVLAGRGLRVVAAALGPRIWSDHRPVVATVAPAS